MDFGLQEPVRSRVLGLLRKLEYVKVLHKMKIYKDMYQGV